MSDQMAVQCPQCGTKLGLRDDSLFGKKVACANCRTAFVIADSRPKASPPKQTHPALIPGDHEPVAKLEDEFNLADPYKDDYDDFDSPATRPRRTRDPYDDYDDFTRPRRRRSKPSPAKKKNSNQPPAWIKPTAIICVSLLAVVCVGAGIFLAVRAWGGGAKEVERSVAAIASESEVIIAIRVDKIREHKEFREHWDKAVDNPSFKQLFRETGMDAEDIELIAIGLSSTGGMQNLARGNPQGMMVLMRADRAWSQTVIRRGHDALSHNSREYFRDRKVGPTGTKWAFFLPDRNTIVAAEEHMIKRLLDNKTPESIEDTRFKSVDFSQHVVFAYAPKSGNAIPHEMKQPVAGTPMASLADANIRAVSVGATADSSDIKLKVEAECGNSEEAMRIAGDLQKLIDKNRDVGAGFLNQLPNGAGFGNALDNLRITTEGESVVATTSIPMPDLDRLRNGGGFNPFRGGFPGMPRVNRPGGRGMPVPFPNPVIPRIRQPVMPEMPAPRAPVFRPPTTRMPAFRPPRTQMPAFRPPRTQIPNIRRPIPTRRSTTIPRNRGRTIPTPRTRIRIR